MSKQQTLPHLISSIEKRRDDKFIVGMVTPDPRTNERIEMFVKPTEYNSLVAAENYARDAAMRHGQAFEVFKRVSRFGKVLPPIGKVEFI